MVDKNPLEAVKELLNQDAAKAFLSIEDIWNDYSEDGGKNIAESNLENVIRNICDKFGVNSISMDKVNDYKNNHDDSEIKEIKAKGDSKKTTVDQLKKENFIKLYLVPIFKVIKESLEA